MVHLLLASSNGNQGLRYFPFAGLLGLTPVKVDGLVGTRLDSDAKPLRAKSLSVAVRCYESRHGPFNTARSNILAEYSQLLWSKPDHLDYESISDLHFPFQITLPTNIAGFSTSVFVDYRCVWRVEAGPFSLTVYLSPILPPLVLVHVPLYGVGEVQVKHFELPLVRYDLPPYEPSPPRPILDCQTTNPKAPRIMYCVHTPTTPIGPKDLVSIPVYLRPLNPDTVIRSAYLTIERRISLKDDGPKAALLNSPASASAMSSGCISSPPTSAKRKRPSTAPANSRFSMHPFASPKIVSDFIAGVESSGSFSKDRNDMWTNVMTLQWPAPKSHSRWAIGETIDSKLVTVKFLAHVKVSITRFKLVPYTDPIKVNVASPAGNHSIDLAEKELLVVSTSEAERRQAASKYAVPSGKSSSPRRSRRAHEVVSPSRHTGNAPAPVSQPAPNIPKVRRPHTSAGPWDKAGDFSDTSYTLPRSFFREARGGPPSPIWKRRKDVHSVQKLTNDSTSSKLALLRSRISVNSTCSSNFDADSDAVREWEEELARIEMRSRRSSELIGFPWKRRRSEQIS